jgi:hypothetical protein
LVRESHHGDQRRDLAYEPNDGSAPDTAGDPGLMAIRKIEKERLRQERLAGERAGEERAQRRERRIYLGLGAGLLVLAIVTEVIVSSRGSTIPSLPTAAPSSPALALASSAPAGARRVTP